MNRVAFAMRLKHARELQRMTQQELAAVAEVAKGTVTNAERGLMYPQLDNAVRVADALGVSLDWLTGRSDYWELSRREKCE